MNTAQNISNIGNKTFIKYLIEYVINGYGEPAEAAEWISEQTDGEITKEMFTYWINTFNVNVL